MASGPLPRQDQLAGPAARAADAALRDLPLRVLRQPDNRDAGGPFEGLFLHHNRGSIEACMRACVGTSMRAIATLVAEGALERLKTGAWSAFIERSYVIALKIAYLACPYCSDLWLGGLLAYLPNLKEEPQAGRR
jgi:hypothetical protein